MTIHVDIPANIEELVRQYVLLRDKVREAEDAHKAKLKDAKEHLEKLNNTLLERLNQLGGESVKTASGTVYRTTKRSASIKDGAIFRQFVIDNALYELVDWRANANAVDDFIQDQKAPPPGVDFSTTYTVGVRRS
jgi:hypothetical protein